MKDPTTYRGWTVTYHPNGPVTGKWNAMLHGVNVHSSTEEGVERAVDRRITEYPKSNGA